MNLQSSMIIDLNTSDENGCQSVNDNGNKRRCLHFPVRDKLKHIKRLEKGESARVIAHELGLSPATVRRWRHHRGELEKFDDIENRKRVRMGANPRLDEAVYVWFEKRRAQGIPISGTILKDKATELNERMGGDRGFNASDGWLTRWKTRHGISLGILEEGSSRIDENLPITYEEKISKMLQSEMNLTSSQVFNVALTTLNWKVLPIRPKIPRRGTWGNNPDRVTIMTCSNADSTLKLRLLVIGKSAEPRGLKNVRQLAIPVFYTHQENATMNSQIFGDWFVNEFAPRVTEFLISKKMQPRALLLLDDKDPISPDLAIGDIRTMVLPSDETLSMRTLKHRVTRDLKRRYRQGLLESASDAQDKGHDPMHLLQILGMKDIVFRLDDAWTGVSSQTIVDSWNNLLPPLVPLESDPLAIEDQPEVNDVLNLLRKIAGNEEITEEEVDVWINNETLPRPTNVQTIGPMESERIEVRKEKKNVEENDVLTPTQAVEALDSVIQFFERHGRLSAVELAALRKARDVASATKRKKNRQ